MKTTAMCALALMLSPVLLTAAEKSPKKDGISISFNSDDDRTRVGVRHVDRDTRLIVTTRGGDAQLMITFDAVAIQLSDAALAKVDTKDDANFIEELLAAGVRVAVRKSVEYPIANVRSAEVRDGVLTLTTDQGKPLFADVKVNGQNVLRDISAADAAKFVNRFREAKTKK